MRTLPTLSDGKDTTLVTVTNSQRAQHDLVASRIKPGPGAEVCIAHVEVRGDVDVVAFGVVWYGWGAVIVQTYTEDEDGVAAAHQEVIGRPLTDAQVLLAVDVIRAGLWPHLVETMDY